MAEVTRIRWRWMAPGAALVVCAILVWWQWPTRDAAPPATPSAAGALADVPAPAARTDAPPGASDPSRRTDAGASAAAKTAAPAAQTLVRWGTGPGELGRAEDHEEGEAELPLSFAVDGAGNIQAVDKPNRRIVRLGLDGSPQGTLPLPGDTEQAIATADDGSLLLVNEGDVRQVRVIGPDGTIRAAIPIPGSSHDGENDITGLFVSGDDVFVGYRGRDPMHVGDLSGNAVAQPQPAPGQPSRDDRTWVSVGISDPAAGQLYVTVVERDPQRHRFTRQLTLPFQIAGIFFADTDKAGEIYIGLEGTPPGGSEESPVAFLLCVEPESGSLLGLKELPANGAPALTFRDAKVTDSGLVVYSVWTPDGVRFEQHQCP